MKVVVFTTSYPRHADDFAGRFVSDPVERLRARGLDVEVVHPGVYNDYGVAYQGGGIMHAVRRRPWIAPLLALSMIRALRRAARDADLVHAMWLAGGVIALFSGKPFVVSLLGSISGGPLDDFLLMRRQPRLVRFICHRARATICISQALVESAQQAGIRNIRFIPIGIEIPETVGEEAVPPEVFYTGRLSPEKGVQDLAAAREGLNLIVSGDGPLRQLFPDALGFISRAELEERFNRAAVVVGSVAQRGLRRRLRARRWRTAEPSWPGPRVACSASSATARPACSSSPATRRSCVPRSTACSPTPRCASAWASRTSLDHRALLVGQGDRRDDRDLRARGRSGEVPFQVRGRSLTQTPVPPDR